MLLFISEGSVLDFCFSVDMFSYICMVNVMRKEMDLERIYLERLRKGSYKDFTKLYELYVSRLYAFALGLTHSDVLAKDIVQETFIKVWIRREQIDPDMSFRSFLFTMAKNQLLNEFRRQANSPLFWKILHLSNQENVMRLLLNGNSLWRSLTINWKCRSKNFLLASGNCLS